MSNFANSRFFNISKSYIFSIFFMLMGLIIFQVTNVQAQTTVTLTADRDNSIYRDLINNSNGQGDLFAGNTVAGTTATRRGLVHFDIAGAIPVGADITNVVLTLTVVRANRSGNTGVAIRRLSNDWGEAGSSGTGQGAPAQIGDATWNARFFNTQLWTTAGGDFALADSDITTVGGNGAYTWGSNAAMIDDVQTWLDTPSNNFGWIIIGDETVATTAKRYASRENATVASRPSLAITYLPRTAAGVSVSGSVRTKFGRPIRNTMVSLTGPKGITLTRYTGTFGLYRFEDLRAGESYIITVKAPRYSFAEPTQVVTANDNLNNIDFVAAGR